MDFTSGGRLEVRITRADVGKRVTVRRVTDAPAPGARFTDTVGVLTSWDAGVLRITRRNGETVRILESSVVAAKVVPDTPARRRGPAARWDELDRIAARAWPPVESARLGDWELRWARGFTRRANSVLALGDPGVSLDEALARVTAWYGERGRPAYVQVSTGESPTGVPYSAGVEVSTGAGGTTRGAAAAQAQEELAGELAARGWTREASALVRTAPLAPLAEGTSGGAAAQDVSRVALSRTVDAAWLARYRRVTETVPEAVTVLGGGPSVWFATVLATEEGAPPAAIGRCVVDGRWAGFTAIEVAPERRRQGLGTAVMAALARKALEEGASAAYLQVETDNGGAAALYDGLGFTTHHAYHHWRAPEGGATDGPEGAPESGREAGPTGPESAKGGKS